MGDLTAKAVLQRNYLFRGLSESIIDRIATLAVRRTFEKGAIVFSQGDSGDALYGIASGQVRVSSSGADGREFFLNIMEPGDAFGEIAVIDGLPRTATVTAVEPTVLFVIRRADFLALLKHEPQLAAHLLTLFCERLRWTSDIVDEAAFLTAPGRLASRLLSLAATHGRQVDGGIELQLSQSELAHFLAVSRQVVNQYLQDWRARGFVELKRARIVILDPDALRVTAEETNADQH